MKKEIKKFNDRLYFLAPLVLVIFLLLSFKFGRPVIFILLAALTLLYVLIFSKEYTIIPFIILLTIIGANLYNLQPDHGYDGKNHINYIERIAEGDSYQEIKHENNMGYLLPVYYTLPKYAQMVTGLPIGRAAQILNFLYAVLTSIFFLLIIRTKYLASVPHRAKLIAVFIMFSAASISRTFSYLRSEPLQLLFIVISVYFLIKSQETENTRYVILSILAAAAATLTRSLAIFYFAALVTYYAINALVKKKHTILTGIIIISIVGLLVLPYAVFKANPFHHPAEGKTAYGALHNSEHFNPEYILNMETSVFRGSPDKLATNYAQAFLHDWWGDWIRYYHKYDNQAMWIIHLALSYAATLLIFSSIGVYIFKKRKKLLSMITQLESFFILHLLFLLAGIIYLSIKVANVDMDVLKAVYFIQAFPTILLLFLASIKESKLNNRWLLVASVLFFITSIYTHLLAV